GFHLFFPWPDRACPSRPPHPGSDYDVRVASVHACGYRFALAGRVGSALPLPHLPPPPPHADSKRLLDAYPVRRPSHRIHLPLRTWDTKGGGAPNNGPSEPGLGAPRRHLERAVRPRRNQEVTRIERTGRCGAAGKGAMIPGVLRCARLKG